MARILIVDDSIVARMSLKSCFQKDAGHEIREGSNGIQAIAIFETFMPDVTFMDLTMPEMDGVEALARIMSLSPSARIIILTADIQRKTIEKVLEMGAFAVAKKPPAKEEINSLLCKALADGAA